ncbi:MAG TPA: ABC transporter permease subunit [Opitutaceae bacterium]|nr:ABC transporter permease subunit [Opitutaceae bacterium]
MIFRRASSSKNWVERLLPAWTAVVLGFLYLPIAVLIVYSFNRSRLNVVWEGFTLKWYGELWRNTPLLDALKNSLYVAVITTALSLVLGTAGAWLMYRYRFVGARLIHGLVAMPIIMPEIIIGISLLSFFAAISMPLGFTTVIVAHVTFCFPFVLVAVQARLQGLDPALEEAALDLGATPFRAFWHVILPLLRPALVAGGLMTFTLSLDELIVTFFTASARSATLPLKIYGLAKIGLNPMLNALSALLIIVTIAAVVFSSRVRSFARTALR